MGAGKMRRRRRQPVSTLRTRLGERVRDRYDYREFPEFEDKSRRPFFLLGLFRQMHSHLMVKITVAVVVVFLAGLFSSRGFTWARPVVEGLRFVTTWNVDMGGMLDRAIPAFKTAWENGELPRFGVDAPAPAPGMTPVEGVLRSGFGPRRHPASGMEQMHYGIDLVAPAGSPVRAVMGGRVAEISGESSIIAVLLEHDGGWQTLYRGLATVEAAEGEWVDAGQELGSLGEATLWEKPHLHFELRYRGRPVEPPADWVALFRGV